MQTYTIQRMEPGDWEQVRTIYLEGIATGDATFEAEAPAWEQWDAGHLAEGRFVACTEKNVIGWAALSPVSSRCVYEGVAEVSVYVSQSRRGQGVGAALLGALITDSEEQGFWTLQASLFPENTASLALHLPSRLPRDRQAGAHREDERHLARHHFPGTPKFHYRRLRLRL